MIKLIQEEDIVSALGDALKCCWKGVLEFIGPCDKDFGRGLLLFILMVVAAVMILGDDVVVMRLSATAGSLKLPPSNLPLETPVEATVITGAAPALDPATSTWFFTGSNGITTLFGGVVEVRNVVEVAPTEVAKLDDVLKLVAPVAISAGGAIGTGFTFNFL